MSIELSLSTAEVSSNSNNQQISSSSYQQGVTTAANPTKAQTDGPLAKAIAYEATSEAQPKLQKDQLEAMAQKLQDFVAPLNRGLEFSVDEDSGRDVIKVIDKDSGDIVRQYPSEEVLELVASLSDAAGMFVNVEV